MRVILFRREGAANSMAGGQRHLSRIVCLNLVSSGWRPEAKIPPPASLAVPSAGFSLRRELKQLE